MSNFLYHVDGSIHKRVAWVLINDDGDGSTPSRVHDKIERYYTNNEMEYLAVFYCLNDNIDSWQKNDNILIQTDSKLIVEQLNNHWSINKKHLRPLNGMVRSELNALLDKGIVIAIEWIPREQNKAGYILEDLVKQDYKYKSGKRVHLSKAKVEEIAAKIITDFNSITRQDNVAEFVRKVFKECLDSEVVWV